MICEHCGVNTDSENINMSTRCCFPCHRKKVKDLLPDFSWEMRDLTSKEKALILKRVMEDNKRHRGILNNMSEDKKNAILLNYIRKKYA